MKDCKRLLELARRGRPFLADSGRAFISLPAANLGCYAVPLRSRAFRQWFYDQCYSEFDTIPTSQAFAAILHHLDAQAARDPNNTRIRVSPRISYRAISHIPEAVLLDLADPEGRYVEITPQGWTVTNSPAAPFETAPFTRSVLLPERAEPDPYAPLDLLRSTLNLGGRDNPAG